jgi:hypothetical protein
MTEIDFQDRAFAHLQIDFDTLAGWAPSFRTGATAAAPNEAIRFAS